MTDMGQENDAAARFDDVLEQAERIKEDVAALASSAHGLLEDRIREKPLQSLLIGIGIGWIVGKLF